MLRSSLLLALCVVVASSYASDPTYSTQPIETRRRYTAGPIQTRVNDEPIENRRQYTTGPIQTRGDSADEPIETRTRYTTGPIQTRANGDSIEARSSLGSLAEARVAEDNAQDNVETRKVTGLSVDARRNVRVIHSRSSEFDEDVQGRRIINDPGLPKPKPRSLEIAEARSTLAEASGAEDIAHDNAETRRRKFDDGDFESRSSEVEERWFFRDEGAEGRSLDIEKRYYDPRNCKKGLLCGGG